ncbi:hypothetical protein BDR26DRAFT_849038 [Obelidium mucronatum]|nr:hypothetical protein BDR26DRAFT_849038 [Obelidium mucronatum]
MFLYFFGCLAGFGFLIERMYNTLSRGNTDFKRIEIPFLMYSSIALSLSFASFICGLFCWFNFGKGLKQVLMQETKMRSGQLEAPVIDLDA